MFHHIHIMCSVLMAELKLFLLKSSKTGSIWIHADLSSSGLMQETMLNEIFDFAHVWRGSLWSQTHRPTCSAACSQTAAWHRPHSAAPGCVGPASLRGGGGWGGGQQKPSGGAAVLPDVAWLDRWNGTSCREHEQPTSFSFSAERRLTLVWRGYDVQSACLVDDVIAWICSIWGRKKRRVQHMGYVLVGFTG